MEVDVFKGRMIEGDFEKNTMTFEIEGEMILKSGDYCICDSDIPSCRVECFINCLEKAEKRSSFFEELKLNMTESQKEMLRKL